MHELRNSARIIERFCQDRDNAISDNKHRFALVDFNGRQASFAMPHRYTPLIVSIVVHYYLDKIDFAG